ncbi:TPA: immunoglobulin-like domain-containing protein, partial [Bacillus cereus]
MKKQNNKLEKKLINKKSAKKGLCTSIVTVAIGSQLLTAIPNNTYAEELNTVKAESNIDMNNSEEAVKAEPKTDANNSEEAVKAEPKTDANNSEEAVKAEPKTDVNNGEGAVEAEPKTDANNSEEAVKAESNTNAVKGEVGTQNQTATDSIKAGEENNPETKAVGIFSQGKLDGGLTTYKPMEEGSGLLSLHFEAKTLLEAKLAETTYITVKLPEEFKGIAATPNFKKYISGKVKLPNSLGIGFKTYEYKESDIDVYSDRIVFKNPRSTTLLVGSKTTADINIDFGKAIKETDVHVPKSVDVRGYEFKAHLDKAAIVDWNLIGTHSGQWFSENRYAEAPNNKPVIEAKDQVIKVGDKFDPKAGVTAHDEEDGDLTDKIEIVSNNVDTNKPGEYTVVYKVTDSDGNTVEKQIKVTVNTNEIPVIEAEDLVIKAGDKFDPKAGVKAHDKEDGDLTGKIEIVSNNVDTNKPGEYTVVYRVTDSDGNTVEKQIKVTVESNEIPVIEAEDIVIKQGDKFDPKAGVKAHDKEDGDLTSKIEIVSNNVDTNKAGEYAVVYRVTDSDGNTAEKQIKVTVTAVDYSVTANDYNLDADSYVIGTVGNDVEKVQIKVNGKVVNNITPANGSYKAYLRTYVTSVQDVVTVTSFAGGEAKETVTVNLTYNNVVLTADDYTIGEDFVVGKVDKRATSVVLFDADTNTALRQVKVNADGTYTIAASDLINSTTKNYVVVAKEGTKELKRVQVNVKEAPQEDYVLTANDYTLGDQYVTGEYDP